MASLIRQRWSSRKTENRNRGAEYMNVNRPLLHLLVPSSRSMNYSQCSDRLPHFLPYLHPYSSVLFVFSPLLPFICSPIRYLPHKSGWMRPRRQMKSDVRRWRMAPLVHGALAARLRRFTPWPIHSACLLSEMYLSLAAAIKGRQIKREKQHCLVPSCWSYPVPFVALATAKSSSTDVNLIWPIKHILIQILMHADAGLLPKDNTRLKLQEELHPNLHVLGVLFLSKRSSQAFTFILLFHL